ncbi:MULTISPECIES: hypothetical protein [Hungatella]|uniref:hypothetical protein n=1 Tax=Hungatella TaxID=1649459 RepID=UPI0016523080|nr:hypothetical protein [Hungatella hathewayi]
MKSTECETFVIFPGDLFTVPGCESFTYENLKETAFESLRISEKFTPIIYHEENGAFAGKSVSIFSPVLKFTLEERFDSEVLEVSETFEVNGKRTFGYDLPLEYRRV